VTQRRRDLPLQVKRPGLKYFPPPQTPRAGLADISWPAGVLVLALIAPVAVAAPAMKVSAAAQSQAHGGPTFDGAHAFEDLKHLVAFGPRPAGSEALARARSWMKRELAQSGLHTEDDAFAAATPAGNIAMTNLIVRIPGSSPAILMVAGHYDTKRFGNFRFVGANDGGSSAAVLTELARVLTRRPSPDTIWLVFFDGEEALGQWSDTDSVYGSRHLVERLASEGQLSRVKGMILVDMIGDSNLDIRRDTASSGWLTDLVWSTARRLGYGRYFQDQFLPVGGDDHFPFINAGVPAVDLIDFDYGPGNRYWHSAEDTVEHCSPQSLEIVGRVVLATLDAIQNSPHGHL
jgi:glutaminyl-peptide cyclotransferase